MSGSFTLPVRIAISSDRFAVRGCVMLVGKMLCYSAPVKSSYCCILGFPHEQTFISSRNHNIYNAHRRVLSLLSLSLSLSTRGIKVLTDVTPTYIRCFFVIAMIV